MTAPLSFVTVGWRHRRFADWGPTRGVWLRRSGVFWSMDHWPGGHIDAGSPEEADTAIVPLRNSATPMVTSTAAAVLRNTWNSPLAGGLNMDSSLLWRQWLPLSP